eukprot:symbB.v1.2.025606.t1/scaffold2446.1/size186988/5
MEQEGIQKTALSQGVVSYSGTVALIRCRFELPVENQPMTLTITSTNQALRAAGWSLRGRLDGLRLCPFQPLVPVVKLGRKSTYTRKLVVCSEVLYGLKGPYKSQLVRHWLEYHRLIGVDHFVIYDRDGSLEIDGVLQPYILNGYVTYFPRFSLALSECGCSGHLQGPHHSITGSLPSSDHLEILRLHLMRRQRLIAFSCSVA